jgi:hypothetical protein
LWKVSIYFQCDDLKAPIATFLQSTLTPEKCFAALKERKVPTRCSAEIEYLARHLPELIRHPEFGDLPLPILDAILSDINLPPIEEGELFAFITAIVRRKKQDAPEYCSLFAHIVFEELDPEQMKTVLREVTADNVSGALWAALAVRLAQGGPPDG